MSDLIKVYKKNEVYMTLETNPGVERELTEFFSLYVPGYQWVPAYRNKMWDGKIRLYNSRSKTLYCGLLEYLIEFAKTRNAVLEIDDQLKPNEEVSAKLLSKFVEDLKLHAHGKSIVPRDYQMEAVYRTLHDHKKLLLSPTASGKSLIIYILIRYFLETNDNEKALLVVPTTSLVEQMFSDFGDYSSKDDSWNHEELCHRIYSGKEKINISQRVIITTWQSIYKLPASWFASYGMVIGDEAHNFKAKSLCAIMENLINAKYRIGTTGTLDGTQTHKLVLEGLFGPVYQVTTTKELIDNRTLSQLKIQMILLKYDDATCKANIKNTYQQELDFLVSHKVRNRFIKHLALGQTGNTLVLYNYVEKHGKPLYDMIKKTLDKSGSTRKLFFVSGGVETDERERIRAITDSHDGLVTLHFKNVKIKVNPDESVPLTNNSSKPAKDISESDDVLDSWISKHTIV